MTDTQCTYKVLVRDTYRYMGGKNRFELHYIERPCKRKPDKKYNNGRCWQHQGRS